MCKSGGRGGIRAQEPIDPRGRWVESNGNVGRWVKPDAPADGVGWIDLGNGTVKLDIPNKAKSPAADIGAPPPEPAAAAEPARAVKRDPDGGYTATNRRAGGGGYRRGTNTVLTSGLGVLQQAQTQLKTLLGS